MNPRVFNACLAAGLALVGVGVGLVSVPAALIVMGFLVIGLTLYVLRLVRG